MPSLRTHRDGSASTDSASLWMEARNALLLGRLRHGPASMTARDALEVATRGSAACLGRNGELGQLSVGAAADIVVWPMEGVRFAGALSDPIEAWLRCGPVSPRQTIINGRLVVDGGALVSTEVEARLAQHRRVATAMQR